MPKITTEKYGAEPAINIDYSDDDIVVIGMACHFPSASDYNTYWENITNSKSVIKEIDQPRFNGEAYYKGKFNESNKIVSKWLASIDDVDKFDNDFFNITAKDSILLDPQQRLLLQETWHCIEDASIDLNILQESNTSVYIGAMATDYLLRFVNNDDVVIEPKLCLSNYACALANRISHHFNFKGMSQSSDAACASSILALQQATQSIQMNESDFAIVGGVNVLAHPLRYIDFSKSRMLSPDGICKTFDRDANGYVQGEGIGVVLVTKLGVAKNLKCHIYGVIKSVILTHSGHTRNITVPSVSAQRGVIEKALKVAKLVPEDIGYVETHGTGTMLGDPIEVHAIKEVFHHNKHCYIGSVKTHVGHLEAAAGMAGLIKVLLMLRHKRIPPSINITHDNPLLGLKNSAIKITKELIDWNYNTAEGRCAGISAFSFGGVNAHCIVQEYVSKENVISQKSKELHQKFPFILSAKSEYSILELIKSWKKFINTKEYQEHDLQQICFNLLNGREHFPYRISSIPETKEKLSEFIENVKIKEVFKPKNNPTVVLIISDVENKNIKNDKKTEKIDSLINFSNKIFDQLIQYGVKPRLVTGIDNGYYAALLASGALVESSDVKKLQKGSDVVIKNTAWPFFMSQSLGIFSNKKLTTQDILKLIDLSYPDDPYSECCISLFKDLYRKHKEFSENVNHWSTLSKINITENIDISRLSGKSKSLSILGVKLCLERLLRRHSLKNILFVENNYMNDLVTLIIDEVISEKEIISFFVNSEHGDASFVIPDEVIGKLHALNDYCQPSEMILSQDQLTKEDDFDFNLFNDDIVVHIGNNKVISKRKNVISIADNDQESILFVLTELWQRGVDIQWGDISPGVKFDRISLPAYPFKKESYWLGFNENIIHDVATKNHNSTSEFSDIVVGVFKSVTCSNEIDLNKSFFELGIDSIIIFQLHERLSNIVGDFSVSLFFECQNLAQFISGLKIVLEVTDISTPSMTNPASNPVMNSSNQIKNEAKKIENLDRRVAVIGMAGRYPEANNLDELWHHLLMGDDCVTPVPVERWKVALKEPISVLGKTIKEPLSGGFITDVDKFDADLFGIPPSDAIFMDPHERLFLETAWECFESAGFTRERIENYQKQGKKIGVFVGTTYNNYQLILHSALDNESSCPVNSQTYSIANKVSYLFDLKGPSLVIDTACSSSLYALHLACRSIKDKECDIALVGGVNLSLHPSKYQMLATYGFLSSNGKCSAFAEGGDGYVPSEGVGAFLIQRGEEAVLDVNSILAWVCGTGVSHGGRTNGFTVPDPKAQAEAIRQAFQYAEWQPNTVSYVEAHGTGTALGDPIEMDGLCRIYANNTDNKQYCAIGSIKSNIGHTEAAAGVSQIAKVLLQFKHKKIVPTLLHSEKPNPFICFEKTPFYLPLKVRDWDKPVIDKVEIPRRSGISSFGAGGVNVHVLLEENIVDDECENSCVNNMQIFIFSARNKDHLKEYALNFIQHIKNHRDEKELTGSNIAYTLQFGRELMPHRLSIVAGTIDEMIEKLEKWLGHIENESIIAGKAFYQSDDEDNDFVAHHIAKGNLLKLAKLWVMGFRIPWEKLYNFAQMPRVIQLPIRPLIKQRYWPCSTFLPEDRMNDQLFNEEKSNQKTTDFSVSSDSLLQSHLLKKPEKLENKKYSEEELIIYVKSVANQVLGYSEENGIENESGFFEVGMDSVRAVSMLNSIQKKFNIDIPETIIFNYQNPERLGIYLHELISSHSFDIVSHEPECQIDENISIDLLSVDELVSVLREITEP